MQSCKSPTPEHCGPASPLPAGSSLTPPAAPTSGMSSRSASSWVSRAAGATCLLEEHNIVAHLSSRAIHLLPLRMSFGLPQATAHHAVHKTCGSSQALLKCLLRVQVGQRPARSPCPHNSAQGLCPSRSLLQLSRRRSSQSTLLGRDHRGGSRTHQGSRPRPGNSKVCRRSSRVPLGSRLGPASRVHSGSRGHTNNQLQASCRTLLLPFMCIRLPAQMVVPPHLCLLCDGACLGCCYAGCWWRISIVASLLHPAGTVNGMRCAALCAADAASTPVLWSLCSMLPVCSSPTPPVCCAGPLAATPAAPAPLVAAPGSSGHRSRFSEAAPGALARVGKQDSGDDPVAAMERYAQMAAEKESR